MCDTSCRLADTFATHRPGLVAIAYRMLGSAAEAEDIVQQAFLQFMETAPQDIRSPKAWLATIVTRLSINHLKSARVRREAYPGVWLPEPVFTATDANPSEKSEQDESIRMAFLVVLERLSPIERAVFLLRDVFDYEYAEVASIVGKNDLNCRQILRRARQRIAEAKPRFEVSRQDEERLLSRFVAASTTGNVTTLISLLAEDVEVWSDGGGRAVAALVPVKGRDRVARFLLGSLRKLVPDSMERRFTEINSQRGIVNYLDGRPHSALMIDAGKSGVRKIYIIVNPDKLNALETPAATAH